MHHFILQAAQAQDERRRSSCDVARLSIYINFVWEIHFPYQNAKIKL